MTRHYDATFYDPDSFDMCDECGCAGRFHPKTGGCNGYEGQCVCEGWMFWPVES